MVLLACSLYTLSAHAQPPTDCVTAYPLCAKTFLHFQVVADIGDYEDAPQVLCFMNGQNRGQAEENPTWIAFQIREAGVLTFVITPDTAADDLDFVLFKLPADGDCNKKEIVRCMAAGDSPNYKKSPCMGPNGLRKKEKDTMEDAGCRDDGDNTWLKPLAALAGEKYVLLISNVTAPNGFTIRFEGSAVLEPCVAAEGEGKE